MQCPHQKIFASLDRWNEMHWQVHHIEANYHDPEGVRYSFNAFIRATREIYEIVVKDLNNHPDYHQLFKPILVELKQDKLISFLKEKREYLVHQGMLDVASSGFIGTQEGRRWKISMRFPVWPTESSDQAYARFVELCKTDKGVRGLLGPDCDSYPCLERVWCLPEFPDTDLLELSVKAWRIVGEALSKIIVHLGGDPFDTRLQCAHDGDLVRMRRYSQREFFREVDGIDLDEEA